jgi:hypothetical protein
MVWYLVRRRIMSRMQAGRCERSGRVSNRVEVAGSDRGRGRGMEGEE